MLNQAQVVNRDQTLSDLTIPQPFGHHGREEHGIVEPNDGKAVGSEPPSEMQNRFVAAVAKGLQAIDKWLSKTR